MNTIKLIFIGGFLGAGKTTLLWQAAARLAAQGKRVGLITNDQAPDLVDTALLARKGLEVREVAGSCFCCNFQGLIDAADSLCGTPAPGGAQSGRAVVPQRADVLLAEPVGSCTDLSATILQPLKEHFRQQFVLAPLSVLADPARLREVLTGKGDTLHPSAAYILRKQLQEADLVVINKTDTLSAAELQELRALVAREFPGTEVRAISALKGQGVDEWLSDVLAHTEAGRRIADVDYDTYAEGEAVLGWLNATVTLTVAQPPSVSTSQGDSPRRAVSRSPRRPCHVDWRRWCMNFIEDLRQACATRRADIGHIKLILSGPEGSLLANLTRTEDDPVVRGDLGGSPREVQMVVNARVAMPPEELERKVRASLAAAGGSTVRVTVTHLQSLRPGRPTPTHRYKKTV